MKHRQKKVTLRTLLAYFILFLRFQAFPVEDITFFVGLLGEKQTQRDRKFEGFHPLMSWNNFKSSFDKDFPEFVQHILEHAEERS
jgi:hypothetical protein